MSVSGGPNIVEDGLVFQVDTFNPRSYISGSTIWTDVVNNVTSSIAGVFANPTSYTATPLVVSSSIGNQSITVPNSSSLPNIYFDSRASRFTLSVWASVLRIDVSEFGGTNRGILCRGSYGGFVGIQAGRTTTASAVNVSVATRGISSTRAVSLASSVRTGSADIAQIFNAVMVYDSSSIYGYFNGNYMGTIATSGIETLSFTGSNWVFNSYGGSGGNAGPGSMSLYNASIYNRALSAEEVLQNFNAQRSRFGI